MPDNRWAQREVLRSAVNEFGSSGPHLQLSLGYRPPVPRTIGTEPPSAPCGPEPGNQPPTTHVDAGFYSGVRSTLTRKLTDPLADSLMLNGSVHRSG